MKNILILICYFYALSLNAQRSELKFHELAAPDTGRLWIQPAKNKPAMAIWGHAKGISVAIPQQDIMPRGLIRIFTPYLDHMPHVVTNFIAMEPIPAGQEHRGLSELEMSSMDPGIRGKRFWSSNDSGYSTNNNEIYPARGIIEEKNGKQTLTVYIFCEPFDNGAKVYVRLRFFEERPYEFELTSYASEESVSLDSFILTATMANKARLRTLYLKDYKKVSSEIWPDYRGDAFTPHAFFSIKDMIHGPEGHAYFIAAPNEKDPSKAIYAADTHQHWKYTGKKATQYWISTTPDEKLQGIVNGRYTYWASQSPIPGGISFENFEMKQPFKNGNRYIFGIIPDSPEEFKKQALKGRYHNYNK
ncbi:hypothetical protein [Prevotella sp. 10(H)]|uniref:hypothetical protein n=1 Tax=Prevotella sp. 10(H) TaxID=1158294 RepID=UPI00068D90A8|nr:hypothetical protein [Prevotella sp. 10(H)]